MKFYFLLEEYSMELFLRDLLIRMFVNWQEETNYCFRSYEGKDALKRGIKPFVRATSENSMIRIIIIHDQDETNCTELKSNLQSLTSDARVPILIPIPCRELEAWYLGDKESLSKAYEEFAKVSQKKAFRENPDEISKPSKLIRRYVSSFSKTDAARKMGKIINIDNSKSQSFQYFIDRLKKFVAEAELTV